ncbi:MAG: GAF domain-containing protein [Calditrichaeota bacterium]|nr:MAG: GAF domain-containing protein [Calditrichota bacterium]
MCKIPFIYKRALHIEKDDLVLIKREQEVKKACSALERGFWLSFCCSKKVGKTTFISTIKHDYLKSHANATFIHVDFAAKRLRSFFDLRQVVQNNIKQFIPAQGLESEFEEKIFSSKTSLSQYFLQLNRTLANDKQIIFVFDGLEAINRNFLHYILNELLRLSHAYDNENDIQNFQFIIAGSLGRSDLQLGDEIVFTECTFRIMLEDFTFSQVENLIRHIACQMKVAIQHGFIQLIFEQTNGMGYLIQKICYKMLEESVIHRSTLSFSLKRAKKIITEILREGDSVVDNIIWRLEKNDILVENLVRVMKSGVLQGHFYDRDLQPLVSIGALSEKNGNYRIRNPLFEKFFQDYFTSERIADQYFKQGDFRKSRELYFNVITEQIEAKSALSTLQANSEAITQALNTAKPYDEILNHLSSSLRGVQNCSIMLLEPDKKTLKVESSVGIEPDVHNNFRLKLGEGIAGKVASTGQFRYIHDVTNTVECPDYLGQASAKKHNLGAMIALPLEVNGNVLGVLNITLRKPSTFSDSEVKILEILAQQISLIIRTQPVENRMSQYRHYIILLEELTHFLDMNIEYNAAFEAILETIQRITNSSFNYILFREQQNGQFIYKFHPKAPARLYPPPEFPDKEHDVLGGVLQSGETFISINAQKEVNFRPVWKSIKALVVLPLKVDGEILGCLVISDRQPVLYDEMQHKVFLTLANLTSTAIRKYRLYGLAEKQAQQVISLSGIGDAISHEKRLEKILEFSIRECLIIIGRPNRKAFLFLQDKDHDALHIRAACNEDLTMMNLEKKLPLLSSSSVSRALRDGKPIIENNIHLMPNKLKLAKGMKSEISVPLFFRDQKLGVLCIQSTEPEDFDSNDSQTLMTVASNAAVALTIGELCDKCETQVKETEALYNIGRTINSSLGIKKVLRTICEEGFAACGNEDRTISVFLLENGSLLSGTNVSINPLNQKVLFTPEDKSNNSIESEVLHTKKHRIIPRTKRNKHFIPTTELVQSALLAPITFDDAIIGLIKMESNRINDFNDVALRLVTGLANQAGLAIHNAQTSEGLVKTQVKLSYALEKAAIEEAIAGLTHDIKNILTNIASETQWLHKLGQERKIKQKDIDAALEDITGSLNRIEEFTTDLSNRTEGEKPEFSLVPAKQIIDEALTLFGIEKWNKINLEKPIKNGEIELKVDKARITRAIFNIINNAIDAMGEKGTLTVRGHVEDEKYIIKIEDTGCGIDNDKLNRVFYPFETTKNKGYGLGLALTKRIVQSDHDGKLALQSHKNIGTTVSIILPVPKQKIAANFSNGKQITAGAQNGRPAQILIVNDDKTVLSKLKRHLQHDGHFVVSSQLGRNAVNKCASTKFDMVILDYHLNKDSSATCSADDFVAELRCALPGIPIILTSATARPRDINIALYDSFLVLDSDFWYRIHQVVFRYLANAEKIKKLAAV